MKNTVSIFLIIVGMVVGVVAYAQQPTKIPRIGHLNPGSSKETADVVREPFERGLKQLGWTLGSNIIIEYRYAEGSNERLAQLALELVNLPVAVIVARGPQAIRAAQKSTTSIPIVMSSAADPVADGFVASLARPGGNITGLSNMGGELEGKRLELLKETMPRLTRVAAIGNPKSGRYRDDMPALLAAAKSLGVESKGFAVSKPDDIEKTFAAINRANFRAVLVRTDALVLEPNREQVVTLAAKYRLAAIYPWTYYVDLGGLMAYATSVPAFHYRSATHVDKILRGTKPADIPVEQPMKFEFVVNLKTAKQISLTIPPNFLVRADRVIR